MKTGRVIFSLLKADFLERTRRSGFLLTLCLVLYLGYTVNSGQVFIQLEIYRGLYNSAWVGGLMALVITFFLGLFGFYLTKNSIGRDEQTGVGQIIATTSISRPQYLLGKWLSNFTLLSTLVGVLGLAGVFMQLVATEDIRLQPWPLLAPLLFVALPMMALVAALAVFFEALPWLKGGFGNLVYFFVFITIFLMGIQLVQIPWLDVTGFSLIGESMKASAKAAFPTYNGSFVLGMAGRAVEGTFIWPGLDWSAPLILTRLVWLPVSLGIVLLGSLFFKRFDPVMARSGRRRKEPDGIDLPLGVEPGAPVSEVKPARLTPLDEGRRFRANFLRLVWLEFLLLVKGLKWYWLVGMAGLWLGCVLVPSENLRCYAYMMAAIWPVLVWSQMGMREARYQADQLIYQAPYPLWRLLAPGWLAGVGLTVLSTSGVLLGRVIFGEPPGLAAWALAVVFIPTLALALGVWSRSSKTFEVVYPILWYLGPFNVQNQLAGLDYLGIHAASPAYTSPLLFGGFTLLLLLVAVVGRERRLRI